MPTAGFLVTRPSSLATTRRRGPKAIRWRTLLNDLFRQARGLAADLSRQPAPIATATGPIAPPKLNPLTRVVLTDEVSWSLFEEYAAHRASARGHEETGWVLLGVRSADEALVTATLPASADRDAGEAHVWITGPAHVLASRIVRQHDRRLTMLGVVHTHPGSLRHPSRGDLRGDKEWIPQLRGGEGVFGIGTADATGEVHAPRGPGVAESAIAATPKPHVQCLGPLRFSWYSLATGESAYREMPVSLTLGPDVARPLRPIWPVIEAHAGRLDRLARQLPQVKFELAEGRVGPALLVTVPLLEPEHAVRVLIEGKEVRYYYDAGGEIFQTDLPHALPDQGVYLLLAELAGRE